MRAGPIVVFLVLALSACGATPRGSMDVASPEANARAEAEVRAVLDAWHLAAAESNEEAYFARMTEDAIFLGTDATERWNRQQFREYAHRPFSEGRGWRMRAIRRDVIVRGDVAYFDEDLEAVNLGPSRGSGVVVRDADGAWRIAHYNLAITVPNERFEAVRNLLVVPPTSP